MDPKMRIRDLIAEDNGEALTGAKAVAPLREKAKQDKLQKQAIAKVSQAVSTTKGNTP